MDDRYFKQASADTGVPVRGVIAVAGLLEEGATVPFIARYRKEATGNLDEVQIIAVRDRLEEIAAFEKRREAILSSLKERELLTDELAAAIDAVMTLNELEDLYLPYRPKKKTRASVAAEKGLTPLAEAILLFTCSLPKDAEAFINPENGVETADDALAGASDIIAEKVSESSAVRGKLRELFERDAVLSSQVIAKKKEEAAKYQDYFDFSQRISGIPSHRFLAVMRGADEGFLRWHILPDEETALKIINREFHDLLHKQSGRKNPACTDFIRAASADAYGRLIAPSLETETKKAAKLSADTEAVSVFAENVRNLLMAAPLGAKRMIAVDPGLRTGCKVVVLGAEGALLEHDVIYPLPPHNKTADAERKLLAMASKYKTEVVAVGNGTGGRETESFLRSVFAGSTVIIESVNESGASVYSASEAARREFPDQDVTVRGAVSIGRRLMDPLAELVKIDPGSIGVGQYQHDVDSKLLKKGLDDVVISCVNSVGVELNTASSELLSYVSGLSRKTADAIVKNREKTGSFKAREQLLKVGGVGDKVYQQAAGFLRINNGKNPLDSSGVHPESYPIVEKMAKNSGCSVAELMNDPKKIDSLVPRDYISESAGLPTVNDIIAELKKPGRDPRDEYRFFSFSEGIKTMSDLKEGMLVNGIVTNVAAFGAFVDTGVHQDGLVHISEISEHFIKNPSDILKVGQYVQVKVLAVDEKRKRISLSMKGVPQG